MKMGSTPVSRKTRKLEHPAFPISASGREAGMTAPSGAARDSRREFKVDVGQVRLDQFLASQATQLTRVQLHRLIGEGQVLLNGRSAKPAQKVRSGDRGIS